MTSRRLAQHSSIQIKRRLTAVNGSTSSQSPSIMDSLIRMVDAKSTDVQLPATNFLVHERLLYPKGAALDNMLKLVSRIAPGIPIVKAQLMEIWQEEVSKAVIFPTLTEHAAQRKFGEIVKTMFWPYLRASPNVMSQLLSTKFHADLANAMMSNRHLYKHNLKILTQIKEENGKHKFLVLRDSEMLLFPNARDKHQKSVARLLRSRFLTVHEWDDQETSENRLLKSSNKNFLLIAGDTKTAMEYFRLLSALKKKSSNIKGSVVLVSPGSLFSCSDDFWTLGALDDVYPTMKKNA
ncbi:hypothetical protein KL949_004050 [Ogataea haglerorum]|nr:hypothetical protein KL913_003968 [Ogataea haglerorum]KAG7716155.1 hypothetical protein KL949_004050 [Ogataea haglerorum]KAG7762537.1 hypothetical protein KL931_005340 [Ogataea haglerorum]KAG7798448.1 hypothetical protein KL944_004590 [Ogataea haglerorum]